MKTFGYRQYRPTFELFKHSDLMEEWEQSDRSGKCYIITVYREDGTVYHEAAEALYLPNEGRLGIAWGSDATWADVTGVESGIEMWLNDPDAWEAAN